MNRIKYYIYNKNRVKENRFCFCKAPFNSMHFSFNGNVYPCHNNNSFPYGRVGEKNLGDIWAGEAREIYKKCMKKADLIKTGCLQCLKDINQNNLKSLNSLRYDNYEIIPDEKYPTIMGFRLSDKCNINCIMCLSGHNSIAKKDNPFKIYDDHFLKELKAFIPSLKYAYFLGGEPFFEKRNFAVFDLFAQLNPVCRINVQTNGTIYNNEIQRYLDKNSFDINVSIDSLNESSFENIRRGAKFETVFQNVSAFSEYCKKSGTTFSSCFTPMKFNILDFPEILSYYNAKKYQLWINKYYFPAKFSVWALAPSDIMKTYNVLSKTKMVSDNDIAVYNNSQLHGYLKVLESYLYYAKRRVSSRNNFNKGAGTLIDKCRKELNEQRQFSEENFYIVNSKLDEIGKSDIDNKKLFYYLKFFLEVFSGDKLMENLVEIDTDFLLSDIESVAV